MPEKYNPLTNEQIAQLKQNHCHCENWANVLVDDKFNTISCRDTTFSGSVKLGAFTKKITCFGGMQKTTGIYNAYIHNCTIGDNVFISNVSNHISNYTIEEDCVIDNIDTLAVDGISTFGNGTEVAVINEAGGREIPIFENLTAQLAYIIALYRDRTDVLDKIKKMIADFTKSVASDTGIVGKDAQLTNCGTIKNVKIGPAAIIGNAKRLENGTIKSCPEDPAEMGANIIAKNFIVCEGAKISDNSILSDCFIGQATHITKQFSAENSVFFANCGLHHGEGCSVFAGPYTVTHHKSTLLLAGLYSFFNAGSGSNQSNHMYKVGSVQQGILERGTKTTSNSYMLYPARIGAFSVVMGRHYAHPDTSDIPFSYLFEENGKSFIVPGINLCTVGTVRDSLKWPQRDNRKAKNKDDLIIFDCLSPYTVQKIINGLEMLLNLRPAQKTTSKILVCNNLHFRTSSLMKGIEYYHLAISKFLGQALIDKLSEMDLTNQKEIENIFNDTQNSPANGKWLDLAGLLTPATQIENLLSNIESGKLNSIDSILETFKDYYKKYNDWSFDFAANKIHNMTKNNSDISITEKISQIIKDYISAIEKFASFITEDAKKDFSTISKIGYGIDGSEDEKQADFTAVRGEHETNKFVTSLAETTKIQIKTAKEIMKKIEELTTQN